MDTVGEGEESRVGRQFTVIRITKKEQFGHVRGWEFWQNTLNLA